MYMNMGANVYMCVSVNSNMSKWRKKDHGNKHNHDMPISEPGDPRARHPWSSWPWQGGWQNIYDTPRRCGSLAVPGSGSFGSKVPPGPAQPPRWCIKVIKVWDSGTLESPWKPQISVLDFPTELWAPNQFGRNDHVRHWCKTWAMRVRPDGLNGFKDVSYFNKRFQEKCSSRNLENHRPWGPIFLWYMGMCRKKHSKKAWEFTSQRFPWPGFTARLKSDSKALILGQYQPPMGRWTWSTATDQFWQGITWFQIGSGSSGIWERERHENQSLIRDYVHSLPLNIFQTWRQLAETGVDIWIRYPSQITEGLRFLIIPVCAYTCQFWVHNRSLQSCRPPCPFHEIWAPSQRSSSLPQDALNRCASNMFCGGSTPNVAKGVVLVDIPRCFRLV